MKAKEIVLGLGAAMIIAIFLSPFASPWPDGLERVAGDKGFLQKGEGPPLLAGPVPDYAMPGIKREGAATATAGALGTLLTFFAAWGVAAAAARKSQEHPRRESSAWR